jgi:hypothetical protein
MRRPQLFTMQRGWMALPLSLLLAAPAAWALDIVPARTADRSVEIENVKVQDHTVTGRLVNRSGHEISDVRLVVDHPFRWKDEWRPGRSSPSRASLEEVVGPIEPGKSRSFEFGPEKLPLRRDGHFTTRVELLGYTETLPRAHAGGGSPGAMRAS